MSAERFGVDYLLISGQAAILYGAATFSDDVDIWIPSCGVSGGARRLLAEGTPVAHLLRTRRARGRRARRAR